MCKTRSIDSSKVYQDIESSPATKIGIAKDALNCRWINALHDFSYNSVRVQAQLYAFFSFFPAMKLDIIEWKTYSFIVWWSHCLQSTSSWQLFSSTAVVVCTCVADKGHHIQKENNYQFSHILQLGIRIWFPKTNTVF